MATFHSSKVLYSLNSIYTLVTWTHQTFQRENMYHKGTLSILPFVYMTCIHPFFYLNDEYLWFSLTNLIIGALHPMPNLSLGICSVTLLLLFLSGRWGESGMVFQHLLNLIIFKRSCFLKLTIPNTSLKAVSYWLSSSLAHSPHASLFFILLHSCVLPSLLPTLQLLKPNNTGDS